MEGVDTTQAKEHARRLERLVITGVLSDVEKDLAESTYALSGEATVSAGDDGARIVDMREVRLMVAGGGPTAYLAFDWEGRGYYLTNEASAHSELAEYYLGDDFGNIANYLAEKLGGWDQ